MGRRGAGVAVLRDAAELGSVVRDLGQGLDGCRGFGRRRRCVGAEAGDGGLHMRTSCLQEHGYTSQPAAEELRSE